MTRRTETIKAFIVGMIAGAAIVVISNMVVSFELVSWSISTLFAIGFILLAAFLHPRDFGYPTFGISLAVVVALQVVFLFRWRGGSGVLSSLFLIEDHRYTANIYFYLLTFFLAQSLLMSFGDRKHKEKLLALGGFYLLLVLVLNVVLNLDSLFFVHIVSLIVCFLYGLTVEFAKRRFRATAESR